MRREGVRAVVAAAGLAALIPAPAARAQSPAPYGLNDAGGFYNVLPAGEAGTDNAGQLLQFETTGGIPPHFNDQLPAGRRPTTSGATARSSARS
jgi:hypothetical protein